MIATSSDNTYRFTTGLKGDVFGDWHWDASYEFGETTSYTLVRNVPLASLNTQAANAITPAGRLYGSGLRHAAGCAGDLRLLGRRSGGRCLPVDFLGSNLTAAQLAKYDQNEWQTRTMMQHDIMANLRGTLFDPFGAGPIAVAIGGEYRYDSASGNTDPQTLAGLFQSATTTALAKVRRNVTEGYLEPASRS